MLVTSRVKWLKIFSWLPFSFGIEQSTCNWHFSFGSLELWLLWSEKDGDKNVEERKVRDESE